MDSTLTELNNNNNISEINNSIHPKDLISYMNIIVVDGKLEFVIENISI